MMKKNNKHWYEIEVTNKQLALILFGAAVGIVFGVLWLSGGLWQYGMTGVHHLPLQY